MFASDEPNIKLSKIISFNRCLYLTLIVNILIYTIQFHFNKNILPNILIFICWFMLAFYTLTNEVLHNTIKKSEKISSETGSVLTHINTIFLTLLITIITLCTGNSIFLLLFTAPIFISLFSRNIKLSKIIFCLSVAVSLFAEFSGWFKSSFLIVNTGIYTSTTLTYATIITLLTYLGIILSNQAHQTKEKVNLMHNLASTDALTKLINRREFIKRISKEISRAKRYNSSLSLALIDIDFFKNVNDTYGHNVGDTVLKEIGEMISINTREIDIAARYGGEEFALILPETTFSEAEEILERLRLMIEVHYFNMHHIPINITVSIGVGEYDITDKSVEDLCKKADDALYKAKRNGRNRIELSNFKLPTIEFSKTNKHN